MTILDVVGALAAICSSISFTPQVVKIIRTGDTKAISAASFAFTVAAFGLWIVYALGRSDWPLLVNGAICFLLSGFILVRTILGQRSP